MLNLLITGCHGFIGGAVQRHLLGSPDIQVTLLSVRGDDWRSHDFSRYDSILHAAGVAHVLSDGSMDAQYDAVNHRLTVDLAAKARADGVRQFIFLSSIIVFGAAAPVGVRRSIGPDTPPAPANAYGRSKLDAENAIRALETPDFRVAILRPPMIYGRGCKGNYTTLTALARKLPLFPEFENRRSMLYVENLAELIRLMVLNGDRGVFHPRDGEPRSVSEIVREICAAHGKRMRFSRALSPAVRLLGRVGLVRRAFGDMAFDSAMPDYPHPYRLCSFPEAIRKTEGSVRW